MEFAPMHWVVVLVIALIIFGPKKLPELGKGLAQGIKGFKDGLKDTPAATTATAAPPESENKPPETKVL
jgi:sec-independent protein translocase protein TatA